MNYRLLYDEVFEKCPSYNFHDARHEPRYKVVYDFIRSKAKGDSPIKFLLDIGSGRGSMLRGIMEFFPSIQILSTDLNKYHDLPEAKVSFMPLDLSDLEERADLFETGPQGASMPKPWDLLTALEVLEHLEKPVIDQALAFFAKLSDNMILSVSFDNDNSLNTELHPTIEGRRFWVNKIGEYFDIVDMTSVRDNNAEIYVCLPKKPVV